MTDKHTPCIEWEGYRDKHGYGRRYLNGRAVAAHRAAWEAVNGPIPAGLVIDHLCRNPPCINPEHLEPVTSAENTKRGREATKTHCKSGHPFAGNNLVIRFNGRRDCRECGLVRWRAYRQRKIQEGTWTR